MGRALALEFRQCQFKKALARCASPQWSEYRMLPQFGPNKEMFGCMTQRYALSLFSGLS